MVEVLTLMLSTSICLSDLHLIKQSGLLGIRTHAFFFYLDFIQVILYRTNPLKKKI